MKKTLYFAMFLTVTAMLVTMIAYLGYEVTQPYILTNRDNRIKESIQLLYSSEDGFKKNDDQEYNKYQEVSRDNMLGIYEVLNENDEIHAIIYNVYAQGRNGLVYALVAINPYNDEIVGVTYYKHSETPNLGEVYTRDVEIAKLLGQTILDDVFIDEVAGATNTWDAIDEIFSVIEKHYIEQEVHIDG